jgi:hypothetical protein
MIYQSSSSAKADDPVTAGISNRIVTVGVYWMPAFERVKEKGFQLASMSQPDMARTSGWFQAEPARRLMAQRITSFLIRLPNPGSVGSGGFSP